MCVGAMIMYETKHWILFWVSASPFQNLSYFNDSYLSVVSLHKWIALKHILGHILMPILDHNSLVYQKGKEGIWYS